MPGSAMGTAVSLLMSPALPYEVPLAGGWPSISETVHVRADGPQRLSHLPRELFVRP